MARKFEELRSKMSAQARERSDARAKIILAEMGLSEVRQALGLSQKAVAVVMNINQPAVAKIERRTDMYLSTLRQYVAAMGGRLQLHAQFPQGSTQILFPQDVPASNAATNAFFLQKVKDKHLEAHAAEMVVDVGIVKSTEGAYDFHALTTVAPTRTSGVWLTERSRKPVSLRPNLYMRPQVADSRASV